jgi:hypothetical protein
MSVMQESNGLSVDATPLPSLTPRQYPQRARMTTASGRIQLDKRTRHTKPRKSKRWAALNPGLADASSRLQSWIRPDAKKTAGQ